MAKQYHKSVLRLGSDQAGLPPQQTEQLIAWQTATRNSEERNAIGLYAYLRRVASPDGSKLVLRQVRLELQLNQRYVYEGISWLLRNGFMEESIQDDVRTWTVLDVPPAPTDRPVRRRGAALHGITVVCCEGIDRTPCPKLMDSEEVERLHQVLVVLDAQEQRRAGLYRYLREKCTVFHYSHLELRFGALRTIKSDLEWLAKKHLVGLYEDLSGIVIYPVCPHVPEETYQGPDAQEWRGQGRARIVGRFSEKTNDIERLDGVYQAIHQVQTGIKVAMTAREKEEAALLLKTNTYEEVLPYLTDFMFNPRTYEEWFGVIKYGASFMTFAKNFAGVVALVSAEVRRVGGRNDWMHLLVTKDLVQFCPPGEPLDSALRFHEESKARAAEKAQREADRKEQEARAEAEQQDSGNEPQETAAPQPAPEEVPARPPRTTLRLARRTGITPRPNRPSTPRREADLRPWSVQLEERVAAAVANSLDEDGPQ